MVSRGRYRRLSLLSAILILSLGLLAFSSHHRRVPAVTSFKERYPLLWKHVHTFEGRGGVWYIPTNWVQPNPQPRTIIEAAQLAIQATALGRAHRFMPHSLIPLIVHQAWGHRQINTWPEDLRLSVEKWLQFVVEGEMAYFLWEDEGVVEFINQFTPESHEHYTSLPSMVEKTDYFRILVATYVGGIYGDLDTVPLKSPAQWITSQEVLPWTDLETIFVYNSTKPVRAIFGIEADYGGKAKLVDDVLILPITSFRGKYGNMGSKPITDPTALVHHHGQGSWKKFNTVTEPNQASGLRYIEVAALGPRKMLDWLKALFAKKEESTAPSRRAKRATKRARKARAKRRAELEEELRRRRMGDGKVPFFMGSVIPVLWGTPGQSVEKQHDRNTVVR
ncbi:hypothetical protein ANOM_000277 [Aspergillus nomiae NRRL 13137]|uniref:Glycosyl transferase n=1 Tax=Aspergillus nomiae NRRL (strain ATCC 15546 / NRRL 13137 / CBS 260.88 / M93) TaxID=1509407 RepID=A0A0L1JJV5_ASPN3|nr:uncharacterized protein ANOM_000277 [Aspergillus nomiae NRRL 13137]KNG91703.1 hypothetical protein ANOM_000277 [Aspergillus nomiae NRRL 13137]